MIIYFSLYCFFGYLMESFYISLLQRKWISSGLLKGPFIPLYGIGAMLLIILEKQLTIHPFICFFIGGFLLTILEFMTSLYLEKCFHTKCWDYSKHHFHFQGRICLFYSLIWSCLSYLFLYFIHPYVVSLSIINDITCLLSLIYLTFLFKTFCSLLQMNKEGLDFH